MKKIIYFFAISLLCIGCSSSDDSDGGNNDPNNLQGTYISARVNGEAFLARPMSMGFPTIDARLTQNQFLFTFLITGIDFLDNGSFQGIGVGFFGDSFDTVTNGLVIVNDEDLEQDFTFSGYYDLVTANEVEEDFSQQTEVGSFRITALDKDAQTISGEFSFTVTDLISGDTFEITNGVFNDLSYVIQ